MHVSKASCGKTITAEARISYGTVVFVTIDTITGNVVDFHPQAAPGTDDFRKLVRAARQHDANSPK